MSFELRKFAYEKCQDQTYLIIQAFVRLSKTKRIVIFFKTGTFKIIRIMQLVMGCVKVNPFPKRYSMNFVCYTICSKLRMAYISSYFCCYNYYFLLHFIKTKRNNC